MHDYCKGKAKYAYTPHTPAAILSTSHLNTIHVNGSGFFTLATACTGKTNHLTNSAWSNIWNAASSPSSLLTDMAALLINKTPLNTVNVIPDKVIKKKLIHWQ